MAEESQDLNQLVEDLREMLAIEKQKCKLLRNAVKEDREIKQQLQNEIESYKQLQVEVNKEMQSLKDKNVELYSRNIDLEELVSENKNIVKIAQKVPLTESRTTNGHLEEMMNA